MQRSLTLVDALKRIVIETPDHLLYTYIKNSVESNLTAIELDTQAQHISQIMHLHVEPCERAILMYPPGHEFISALFGCFYANIIAVPIYAHQFQVANLVTRLERIIQDNGARIILTTHEVVQNKHAYLEHAPWLKDVIFVATDNLPCIEIEDQASMISPDTIALLQYSSGSTGAPKGVMVSHDNLLSNLEIIRLYKY